jgi:hypothetical protein
VFLKPHFAFVVADPALSCQNTIPNSHFTFMSTMVKPQFDKEALK